MQDFDTAANKPQNITGHFMGLAVKDGVVTAFYEQPKTTEGSVYQIHFGEDCNRKTVIGHIERRGTDVNKAYDDLKALRDKGLLAKPVFDNAVEELTAPKEVVIGGLKLAVGKPSSGVVVNAAEFAKPETQEAFAAGRKNYDIAAYRSVDVGLLEPAGPSPAPQKAF